MGTREHYESLARAYFDAWNTHSGESVAAKFDKDGSLRDWDISVSGAEAVGQANAGIFSAVPGIHITIEGIVVDVEKAVAACEILVHLNDEQKTVLKVNHYQVYMATRLGTDLTCLESFSPRRSRMSLSLTQKRASFEP